MSSDMANTHLPKSRDGVEQEQFLTILSREEALKRFEAALFPRAVPSEARALSDALGCALAQDIAAPIDVPPFDRSNVDGFAVRAGDTAIVRAGNDMGTFALETSKFAFALFMLAVSRSGHSSAALPRWLVRFGIASVPVVLLSAFSLIAEHYDALQSLSSIDAARAAMVAGPGTMSALLTGLRTVHELVQQALGDRD